MKTRFPIGPLVLLGVLLLAGIAPPVHAQQRLTVEPESRLWIEGSSTLDAFTCRSEAVKGAGVLETNLPGVMPAATSSEPRAEVHVRVETFDCGKQRMNRDLYEALKAATHPSIRFELREAEVLGSSPEGEDAYRLRVNGWLTVAGTTRLVETTAHGQRLDDGRYRTWGHQPFLMSNFGIEPPTGLLGLVRAHDHIRVRFDLVAASPGHPSTTTNTTQ